MNNKYNEPYTLNRFWLGFFAGLALPLLVFLLYFLFRFKEITMSSYLQQLFQTGRFVHVISLSVFPNLVPFLFFVRSDRFKSGRGVMAITIFYALLIFGLKFYLA